MTFNYDPRILAEIERKLMQMALERGVFEGQQLNPGQADLPPTRGRIPSAMGAPEGGQLPYEPPRLDRNDPGGHLAREAMNSAFELAKFTPVGPASEIYQGISEGDLSRAGIGVAELGLYGVPFAGGALGGFTRQMLRKRSGLKNQEMGEDFLGEAMDARRAAEPESVSKGLAEKAFKHGKRSHQIFDGSRYLDNAFGAGLGASTGLGIEAARSGLPLNDDFSIDMEKAAGMVPAALFGAAGGGASTAAFRPKLPGRDDFKGVPDREFHNIISDSRPTADLDSALAAARAKHAPKHPYTRSDPIRLREEARSIARPDAVSKPPQQSLQADKPPAPEKLESQEAARIADERLPSPQDQKSLPQKAAPKQITDQSETVSAGTNQSVSASQISNEATKTFGRYSPKHKEIAHGYIDEILDADSGKWTALENLKTPAARAQAIARELKKRFRDQKLKPIDPARLKALSKGSYTKIREYGASLPAKHKVTNPAHQKAAKAFGTSDSGKTTLGIAGASGVAASTAGSEEAKASRARTPMRRINATAKRYETKGDSPAEAFAKAWFEEKGTIEGGRNAFKRWIGRRERINSVRERSQHLIGRGRDGKFMSRQ